MAPVKFIIGAFFMGLLDVLLKLLEKTVTDHDKPMTGWRRVAQRLIIRMCYWPTFLAGGLFVVRRGRLDPTARVLVSNHRCMFDPMIHGLLHQPHFLCRSDLADAFSIGTMMSSLRPLRVSKTTSNKHLIEQMKNIVNQKD